MRKNIAAFILVIAILITVAFPSFAGGDKVRGGNGQGTVVQVHHQDPPPFNP